ELVIGGGVDRRPDRAVACTPAARLVDEINRKTAAQEKRLKSFPTVRGRLPAPCRPEGAAQHDEGKRLRATGNLIEGVEVIAVERLSCGSRLVVLVGPRGAHYRPADCEAALILKREGLGTIGLLSERGQRGQHGSAGQQRQS